MPYHTPTEPDPHILQWIKDKYVYDAKTGELLHIKKTNPVGHSGSVNSYRFIQYTGEESGVIKKTMLAHHLQDCAILAISPGRNYFNVN